MDNTVFKSVGNNIQSVLAIQGKTQRFLAEQLGISTQVMSKIIAGAKAINVAEVTKIAEILHVSVDKLLELPAAPEDIHDFAFMGQVENEATKLKVEFLQKVIDEILMLEEYGDGKETT